MSGDSSQHCIEGKVGSNRYSVLLLAVSWRVYSGKDELTKVICPDVFCFMAGNILVSGCHVKHFLYLLSEFVCCVREIDVMYQTVQLMKDVYGRDVFSAPVCKRNRAQVHPL